MTPLDIMKVLGQSSNDALDRAEASLAEALQTLKGIKG